MPHLNRVTSGLAVSILQCPAMSLLTAVPSVARRATLQEHSLRTALSVRTHPNSLPHLTDSVAPPVLLPVA